MGWVGGGAPGQKKTRIKRVEETLAPSSHATQNGLPTKNTAIVRVTDKVVQRIAQLHKRATCEMAVFLWYMVCSHN